MAQLIQGRTKTLTAEGYGSRPGQTVLCLQVWGRKYGANGLGGRLSIS